MSDLLEKAIIDAKALKEVAVKNAETLIVEKYSQKIKEAVEQLLEQDPVVEIPGDNMLGDVPGEESVVADQIPMAATDGEKMCSCPDDEEEIDIDFSELEKQMAIEKDLDASDMIDREEVATELPPEELKELGPEVEYEETLFEQEKEIKEENLDNIDEEMLEKVIEALEVDFDPKSDGWPGTTDVKKKEDIEGTIAKLVNDDETKEKLEKTKEALKALQEEFRKVVKTLDSFQKKEEDLEKENKELKTNLQKVAETLNESNIINAKLLYTNQVLNNISLNEKQKKTFIEEISKVDSVDNAKVIYEALTNSMGAVKSKKSPKSLNEVVSRPSMTFPIKPNTEKVISDPVLDRMKMLAGIKNK